MEISSVTRITKINDTSVFLEDDAIVTLNLTYPEINIIYNCLVSSGLKYNFIDERNKDFCSQLYEEFKSLKSFIENRKFNINDKEKNTGDD